MPKVDEQQKKKEREWLMREKGVFFCFLLFEVRKQSKKFLLSNMPQN
jgi:hypothetical protein